MTETIRRNRFRGLVLGLALGVMLVAFLLVGCAAARPQGIEIYKGREAAPNEVIVKFRGEAPQALSLAVAGANADETEPLGSTRAVRLHSRSKNVDTLIRELSARGDLEYVEPNYIVHAVSIPNDFHFSNLWGLHNTGQTGGTDDADIDAPAAWDITTGSQEVVVAVIDTGVDYNHEDLQANIWTNTREIPRNGVDDDGNGYVDDIHGINAILNSGDPMDDAGHGTHVSGTIGAVGDNGAGVTGVNWKVMILALKFLDSRGSGYVSDAVKAIDYAIGLKTKNSINIRILSNSWGGGGSQALLDAILRANAHGMLFVAAAGNNGWPNDWIPFYPASYGDPLYGAAPNVVAVAATDKNDQRASWSNYGSRSVHLGAPGVDILSTTPANTYTVYSGTSMATPHVSGAAALVLSKCPTLDTAGLKANILENVDKLPSLNGIVSTGGRLNVDKAIRDCVPPSPDFSLSASPASQTVAPGDGTSYTVTITRVAGFTEQVTLSVTGLPDGASGTFDPTQTSDSFILSITTGSGTQTSTYPLTITGTSEGGIIRTTAVTLTIGTPDFTIAASPPSRTVYRGFTTATYTVTVTRLAGFNGNVALSLSIPSNGIGISGKFNPNPITNSRTSSTLTVRTKTSTPAGTYTLDIYGTSNGVSKKSSVTLVVTKLFGILGREAGLEDTGPAGS